ncbi:hypothetical protein GQ43DRAFT_435036 [Delitschia confertaspora ATCC 74209]|uniref:Uncharacterized protein n=1 Tax=Delitschia confertaspora ATCC 74209 TaxID=1513339 RepID=A0A9P4MV18_9PLEO|nr:hypothetical protein GQ43DRAFT_435036 [Delitschia confertaspora ATCC 74209]
MRSGISHGGQGRKFVDRAYEGNSFNNTASKTSSRNQQEHWMGSDGGVILYEVDSNNGSEGEDGGSDDGYNNDGQFDYDDENYDGGDGYYDGCSDNGFYASDGDYMATVVATKSGINLEVFMGLLDVPYGPTYRRRSSSIRIF